MAIDQIHDLQQVYRKLLHSMARPGTISSIQPQTAKVEYHIPCNRATLLSAMALLDAETTFYVLPQQASGFIERISEYTSARCAPIKEADFIIVLGECSEEEILQAMAHCKIGNLLDPQLSATWIIESKDLSESGELLLSGPGIQSAAPLGIGMPATFWQARNNRVKEYPLGIDLIFADDDSRIACLPRTTSVIALEVE